MIIGILYGSFDIETVINTVDRSDLTENMRKNAEIKLDGTFMLKNIKNEVGARTYGSWMGNEFTNTYTIEDVTNEQVDKFNYRETRQTAYYNLSARLRNSHGRQVSGENIPGLTLIPKPQPIIRFCCRSSA